MKASNWPNFVISSKLANSQKENPRSLYVEDREKVFVKSWNLADDTSCVLAFNKEGKVIFSVDGQLSEEQIQSLVKIVKTELAEKPSQDSKNEEAKSKSKT